MSPSSSAIYSKQRLNKHAHTNTRVRKFCCQSKKGLRFKSIYDYNDDDGVVVFLNAPVAKLFITLAKLKPTTTFSTQYSQAVDL